MCICSHEHAYEYGKAWMAGRQQRSPQRHAGDQLDVSPFHFTGGLMPCHCQPVSALNHRRCDCQNMRVWGNVVTVPPELILMQPNALWELAPSCPQRKAFSGDRDKRGAVALMRAAVAAAWWLQSARAESDSLEAKGWVRLTSQTASLSWSALTLVCVSELKDYISTSFSPDVCF